MNAHVDIQHHAAAAMITLPHIPRSCHQICIVNDGVEIPRLVYERQQEFEGNNPDFTHTLWTKEAIESVIPQWFGREMLSNYRKINPCYPAAQADLFRYLLMYNEGGVYLDLKSSFNKPLSSIIECDDEYILAQWPERMRVEGWGLQPEFHMVHRNCEYFQWVIMCRPRHPFLEEAIDRVVRNIKTYNQDNVGVGFHGVIRTTGPVPYTLAVHDLLSAYPHRIIDIDENQILFRTCLSSDLGFGPHYNSLECPVVI